MRINTRPSRALVVMSSIFPVFFVVAGLVGVVNWWSAGNNDAALAAACCSGIAGLWCFFTWNLFFSPVYRVEEPELPAEASTPLS